MDGFALVALALVGCRNDWQNRVNAAVNRVGILEVTDCLLVVRLFEELLATEEDGVRSLDVRLADFRGFATGWVGTRRQLRQCRERDDGTENGKNDEWLSAESHRFPRRFTTLPQEDLEDHQSEAAVSARALAPRR